MPELSVKNYQDSPSARERLFDFYLIAYPERDDLLDGERFEWQSFGNPLAPPETNFLYHLYDEEGNIIGQNILLPYQLSIGGAVNDALCSTNLVVLPGLVGKGLGHRLIEQHERLGRICFAVGITEASSRAFQKRGWVPMNDSRLQAVFFRPVPCLRYTGKSGLFVWVVSPVLKALNLVLSILAPMRIPAKIPGVTCEEITRFDSAWDSVWANCLKSYAVHFVRRADFLNWKYCTRKDVRHHILLFKMDDRPVAYLVYRLSRNEERGVFLGRITDLVCDPDVHPKFPHYLIAMAKRRLQQEGIDGVVGIASSPELLAAYRANGMVIGRTQPAILKEDGFAVSQLRAQYPHSWYITLGDSDLDNYW